MEFNYDRNWANNAQFSTTRDLLAIVPIKSNEKRIFLFITL